MRSHSLAFLIVIAVFCGCNKKQQSDEIFTGHVSSDPTFGIVPLTDEILASLGPANDSLPLHRLLPNPLYVVAGKPKQFLDSSLGTGNEWITSREIAQYLQLYFIDPSNIEFFVQSFGVPLTVQVAIPNNDPNAPDMPIRQEFINVARRATVMTFGTPVDLPALVAAVRGPDGIDLAALKRTEGKTEYYDITPLGGIPRMRIALGLLDERTIVLAEGSEDDIQSVFSDAVPRDGVLERLKHTPVDSHELTFMMSLETLPVSPKEWELLTAALGEAGNFPPHFVQSIKQHLRAVTLSLNVSAEEGQPVVSVYVEAWDEKGAEEISDEIQGWRIGTQTTLATMSEDLKERLPIPADFAMPLLNALSVRVEGTRVFIDLNNYEGLIPTVAEGIRSYQTAEQQVERQDRQLQTLRGIGEICVRYYAENGQFPADIVDSEGKPLLSWRVALLPVMGKLAPQMGFDDLYSKFKLDEPWDSENNKALLESTPGMFCSPFDDVEPTQTVVRFFDSVGTPFSNRNLKFEDIKEPQNTLMLVRVLPQHAVEWTQPEPLEFNIDTLAGVVGDTFFGIMFSGQIRPMRVRPPTDPQYEDWKWGMEMLIKGVPPSAPLEDE
ncbi:MAG: hypothetical protein LBI05_09370 [Planctomycetaceae bacterium]|nr:hypothetical protein [Planctomycetaceae bacterium]